MQPQYRGSNTATSNKDYIESTLNICQLYRLYKERCVKEEVKPVSEYAYSEILNTETNNSFQKTKSDLCDNCVLWEVKEGNGLMTPEDQKNAKCLNSSLCRYSVRSTIRHPTQPTKDVFGKCTRFDQIPKEDRTVLRYTSV